LNFFFFFSLSFAVPTTANKTIRKCIGSALEKLNPDTHSDPQYFALKIFGRDEYILDDTGFLTSVVYVRDSFKKRRKIEFQLHLKLAVEHFMQVGCSFILDWRVFFFLFFFFVTSNCTIKGDNMGC